MAVQVIAYRIRFRAKLNHSKGHRGTREHMAHTLGANDGLYILNQIFVGGSLRCRDKHSAAKKDSQ